jgi:drug/metabolite transporter (DMT)-like permease
MLSRRATTTHAIVALALAGTLWGLTVPLSKLGMDWLGAGWLAVARFAIAAPLLALLARRHLRAAISPGVVAAGAIGYGGVILLQNVGIERTSVSHAALIVGAVPVLVAVIAAALGHGVGSKLTWGGSLLALAGVGLVAGGGGAGTSLSGDLLVFVSVTGSAAFIVAQPGLLRGRDAGAVTAVQLGAGGLAVLPFAVFFEGMPQAPATAGPVVALVALALAGTALAFSLFAWAQTRVPAEVAGAFVNLEPLVGAATGAVAFHDAVGPAQLLGGAAILAGIALGLPRDRAAVAEEPAGRPVVRERRRPYDAGRALRGRTAARTAHVRRDPARAHGVDEPSVRALRQQRREGHRHPPGAERVRLERLADDIEVRGQHALPRVVVDGGVVDEHVELADLAPQGGARRLVGDVERDPVRDGVRVARARQHGVAARREPARHLAPEPAAGAGDQCRGHATDCAPPGC